MSVQVDGLEPTTTYHVRLVVENEHGSRRGSPVSFTTASAAAPTVSLAGPTGRGQTGVTLNGLVNANNATASYAFEYGTTPSLGASTASGSIGGDTTQPVSAVLGGLAPGTLYHYRLTATNSFGSVQSTVGTFTTMPNAAPTRRHGRRERDRLELRDRRGDREPGRERHDLRVRVRDVAGSRRRRPRPPRCPRATRRSRSPPC